MFTKEAINLKYQNEESVSNSVSRPVINLATGYDELMQNNLSMESILHALKKANSEAACLFIKVKTRCYHKIKLQNVSFVEAQADYMIVHTNERKYVIHSTMRTLLKKLPKTDFAQVHKSFIVRLDLISKIEDCTIILNDKLIPIGETYKKSFFSSLNIVL